MSTFVTKSFVLFFIMGFLFAGNAYSQQKNTNTYSNPVVPGDFPDPSVIRVGDTYYSSGTSSEWAPYFPLFESKDLVNWTQKGYIFYKKPEWALSSFWAPELYYHNHTFYAYYVAKRASDKKACIGVATSTDPEKGFIDHGVIIEYGSESIDPFVVEDKGQLYIIWKAYGLDKRPIELLASKITPDGLKTTGEPFTLLRDDQHTLMEGPSMLKRNGYYYLFYSAGGCCGIGCSYNVRVARATSFEGPYTSFEGNPILAANGTWICPGHGTFVQTPADKYYFIYHAYNHTDNIYTGRQGMLDELFWDDKTNWPYFKNGSPSVTANVPENGAAQVTKNVVYDGFLSPVLASYWQWDYRHTDPVIKLKKGALYLSGKVDSLNQTGTVLTVRPTSGSYDISGDVIASKSTLAGLTVYGDENHAIGIGVKGAKNDTIQVWEVNGKQRRIWAQTVVSPNLQVKLKMIITNHTSYKFYWGQGEYQWNELKPDNDQHSDQLLPAWDRSARPGIIQYGDLNEPGCFLWFRIADLKDK